MDPGLPCKVEYRFAQLSFSELFRWEFKWNSIVDFPSMWVVFGLYFGLLGLFLAVDATDPRWDFLIFNGSTFGWKVHSFSSIFSLDRTAALEIFSRVFDWTIPWLKSLCQTECSKSFGLLGDSSGPLEKFWAVCRSRLESLMPGFREVSRLAFFDLDLGWVSRSVLQVVLAVTGFLLIFLKSNCPT